MTRLHGMKLIALGGVASLFFLIGCGQPELDKSELDFTIPEPEPVTTTTAPATEPEPAAAPKPEPEPEPTGPVPDDPFIVASDNGTSITISGAIKSRVQKRVLFEELAAAFSDRDFVDELELYPSLRAVSWGNRIGEGFVIPFLKFVPGGSMKYQDGVLTLEGEVTNPRNFADIMRAGSDIFAGDGARDIDFSKLKGIDPPARGRKGGSK